MTGNEQQPHPSLSALFDVIVMAFLFGMGSAIVYGAWSFVLERCA